MELLSNAERETHINQCADDRSYWEVYSDDPVLIKKIDKIAEAYKVVNAGMQQEGKYWRLEKGQVTLRNKPKKKVYTDEEKEVLAERLRLAREVAAEKG